MSRLLPAILLLLGCQLTGCCCSDRDILIDPPIAKSEPVHQWRVFKVDGKPRWCDDSTMVCRAEGQGPEVQR